MKTFRAIRILVGFFAFTVPLMPVQAILLRVSPKHARTFPHWYHRQVCRLLGIRLEIDGEISTDHPVLVVANHVSWLDIPVISAVAPVSFIAKREVGGWPFVSSLANLQRTVFVDRSRRTAAAASAGEISDRLASGDKLVLFAEGTSSDGNRVLPFKTSLFAAAKPSKASKKEPSNENEGGGDQQQNPNHNAQVQTLTICYTHLHGVPIERADRPLVGWFGDMDLGPHAWALLSAGPLDVRITLGAPIPLDDFADRKALARQTETEIRTELVRILRGREDIQADEIHAPDLQSFKPRSDQEATGRNWV